MIQLTDKLWLFNDDYGYVLRERKVSKKGKVRYEPYGYYANLKQIAETLVKDGLKVWVDSDWETLKKYFDETYEKFVKAINNETI